MQKIDNWDNVKASEDYVNLPIGGYVFKIVSVEDTVNSNGKRSLLVKCDVAEGEYAGIAQGNEMALRRLRANYGGKADGLFKRFINMVEQCNPRFKWDWDEKKLVGKVFGGVLIGREYEKANGEIAVATDIDYLTTTTVEKIRANDFKVKPITRLNPVDTPVTDDDCPF